MPATTVIEDLRTLLLTLSPAGGVWYAVNTAEPPVYPYIILQRVASSANASLGGPSNTQNTRVQIDIIARRISDAVSLETALEAAMAASSIQNVPVSSLDMFEDEVRAYRVSKDYSIWSTN